SGVARPSTYGRKSRVFTKSMTSPLFNRSPCLAGYVTAIIVSVVIKGEVAGMLDYTSEVELRLSGASDDEALADLAQLSGQGLPCGRLVVADVGGRIVAAVPLGGGRPLADPFVKTEELVGLLELRAAQLRETERRRSLLPRTFGSLRHALHA